MTSNAELQTAASPARDEQVQVLLVEDDDGDALLVGELLRLEPEAAIVVLTGEASEHLGEQAVRSGAQDYLVKGEVAGHMLNRVIRYAVERRRAEEAQRALHAAQIHAQENARLERGLLPSPVLADSRLSVSA